MLSVRKTAYRSPQELRHWLYQSLLYLHVPAAHVVGPVHPLPPHCPYSGEPAPVEVLVAALELLVLLDVVIGMLLVTMVLVVRALLAELTLVMLVTIVVNWLVDAAVLEVDELAGFEVAPPACPSVPVSLMSRELAPIETVKLPVGVIHELDVISQ